jgi:23S rRNA pseudoU1915 N3-methylase RlmH
MRPNQGSTTAINSESVQVSLEYFQNQVDIVIHIGGTPGPDPALLNRKTNDLNKQETDLNETKK